MAVGIIVVENGGDCKGNLMKAKMSEQQLYMQLREKGIHDLKSLQQVTAEPIWADWLPN